MIHCHDYGADLRQHRGLEDGDLNHFSLPGGLWYAIHAVPLLEAEFGKPALLNILSTTWAALHAVRGPLPQRPDPRWGKVLASIQAV